MPLSPSRSYVEIGIGKCEQKVRTQSKLRLKQKNRIYSKLLDCRRELWFLSRVSEARMTREREVND